MDEQNVGQQDITLDMKKLTEFCKKYYVVLFLIAFMVLGFHLRSYHMDFPVIGYHNMKENQYIPYTEFMYNAEEIWDYFRTETYWIGGQEHGYFTQYEFPLIPWLILPLWYIFGVQEWAARLIVILFSIASIPMLYIAGRKLTDNTFVLLTACLFFAIMPISIFFGRNVQPEAPAVFFILLGVYWFFRWREEVLEGRWAYRYFLYYTLCVLVTVLLKIPNGIGFFPLLLFVPYRKLFGDVKELLKFSGIFFGLLLLFPLWVKFSRWVMPGAATVGTAGFGDSLSEVWLNMNISTSSAYWAEYTPIIKSFLVDNFTMTLVWVTLFGVVLAIFKFRTKLGLFLLGSFGSIFLYVFFFADKVRGHAYYQMVYVPFVCFSVAYVLYILASLLKQFLFSPVLKRTVGKQLPLVVLFVFLLFAYPAMDASTDRVFDVIYYGEDVAGEFINTHSSPEERIFIDGVFSQSVGILWHAHRFGLEEVPSNLTRFKELEETLHFRWVVLYLHGFNTIQTKPEVWEYIQNEYHLRHVGLVQQNGQFAPYSWVLEKGGTFDSDAFFANKQPYLAKTYTHTGGTTDFYVIDDEH